MLRNEYGSLHTNSDVLNRACEERECIGFKDYSLEQLIEDARNRTCPGAAHTASIVFATSNRPAIYDENRL